MQKSIRLLKIWKLCREKRMMTAARLAPREIVAYIHYSIFPNSYLTGCGVDQRTIYRDIQALCEMGVTLAGNGGYHVIAEDVLPQLNLTRAEQLVVTLALRHLPLHLDKELEEIANGVLNKLLEQPVEGSGVALEAAKVGPFKPGVFSRLHRAISEHRLITFVKYRELTDEEEKDLRLEPYRLRFMERAWYLVAWSFKRSDFRTYRLDRINKLRIDKETFEKT